MNNLKYFVRGIMQMVTIVAISIIGLILFG